MTRSSLHKSKRGIQERGCVKDVIVTKLKAKMARREKEKDRKIPGMCFLTQSGISYLKHPVEETSLVSSTISKEDSLMPLNGQGSYL